MEKTTKIQIAKLVEKKGVCSLTREAEIVLSDAKVVKDYQPKEAYEFIKKIKFYTLVLEYLYC